MSTSTNIDGILGQKLSQMENALVRIAIVKSQLRTNADQARKDIRLAIDHQLQCIRGREQELLSKVDTIFASKEQRLYDQQEHINRAIGACKQILEDFNQKSKSGKEQHFSLHSPSNATNFAEKSISGEILLKINSLELCPRESSTLTFQHDHSELRRNISEFGHLLNFDDRKNYIETLPINVVEGEDDTAILSHKSVYCLEPTPTTNQQPKKKLTNFSDSINHWLSQVRNHNSSNLLSDEKQHFLRERLLSNGSQSSFEVIGNYMQHLPVNPNSPSATPYFIAHFTELNQMPLEYWLKKDNTGSDCILQNQKASKVRLNDNNGGMSCLAAKLNEIHFATSTPKTLEEPSIMPKNQRKRSAGAGSLFGQGHQEKSKWLKSQIVNKQQNDSMWYSQSCAKVITAILASPTEDWLPKTPPNKMVHYGWNLQQPKNEGKQTLGNHGRTCSLTTVTSSNVSEQTHDNEDKQSRMNSFLSLQNSDDQEHLMIEEDFQTQIDEQSQDIYFAKQQFVPDLADKIRNAIQSKEVQQHVDRFEAIFNAKNFSPCSKLTIIDELKKGVQNLTFEDAIDKKIKTKNSGIINAPLKLPSDPAHWLKMYPPPKTNRPMNEMAEDLSCWESVLGWKSILEKIHASGEDVWLAPSSRGIKNV